MALPEPNIVSSRAATVTISSSQIS